MSNDPSPSAETPDQLIAQWRKRAAEQGAIYASGLDECANELEALLRRGRSALPSQEEDKA